MNFAALMLNIIIGVGIAGMQEPSCTTMQQSLTKESVTQDKFDLMAPTKIIPQYYKRFRAPKNSSYPKPAEMDDHLPDCDLRVAPLALESGGFTTYNTKVVGYSVSFEGLVNYSDPLGFTNPPPYVYEDGVATECVVRPNRYNTREGVLSGCEHCTNPAFHSKSKTAYACVCCCGYDKCSCERARSE